MATCLFVLAVLAVVAALTVIVVRLVGPESVERGELEAEDWLELDEHAG